MEDQFKLAMDNAVKWYAEGIIAPERFTRGQYIYDPSDEWAVGLEIFF